MPEGDDRNVIAQPDARPEYGHTTQGHEHHGRAEGLGRAPFDGRSEQTERNERASDGPKRPSTGAMLERLSSAHGMQVAVQVSSWLRAWSKFLRRKLEKPKETAGKSRMMLLGIGTLSPNAQDTHPPAEHDPPSPYTPALEPAQSSKPPVPEPAQSSKLSEQSQHEASEPELTPTGNLVHPPVRKDSPPREPNQTQGRSRERVQQQSLSPRRSRGSRRR